ncbi:hypothetical protein FRB96_002033 [Tulasnella sp. 330]|nr:hypothetical protein FRB96_002033 [Tulasnella sp. 330]KAG8870514.1 hypothetical protein FRB97_009691 [Tulasnella sp. 331]KAG8876123.1 hypothetical protein FRB98_007451 [Tulasnella sp. 332]
MTDSSGLSRILCANRDEYLDRPTLAARFHSFEPQDPETHDPSVSEGDGMILSGRDSEAGGTWLGMTRSGRIALLTNITEAHKAAYTTSRGELATSFLTSQLPLDEFVIELTSHANKKAYAGFNLLLLNPSSTPEDPLRLDGRFISNGGGGGVITARPLRLDEQIFGGISNGAEAYGGDEWPKVVLGRKELGRAIEEYQEGRDDETDEQVLIGKLFDVLRQATVKDPRGGNPIKFSNHLSSHSTPEEILSRGNLRSTIRVEPIQIPSKDKTSQVMKFYGTRLATFILVKRTGEVTFVEKDVWKGTPDGGVVFGTEHDDRVYQFELEPPQ